MYKLINRIENIQNVYISLDNYIFVDKNDNFYLNGIKESSYKSIYFVLDGYILKQNTENKSFLYLNDTLIKEINHSYIFSTYSENGCFYYENLHYDPKDDKVKKDIYYHDFRDNSIRLFAKGFSENFQLVLDNNTITFQPRTTLKSLSLLTGEYEWEVDLGAYGEIRNILGIVEDELYVWLGSTTLVAISIQNGEIQWYINTYETHKVGFGAGVHLLADERKVVLFYDTNYVEIDLQTQTSKLLLKNSFGKDWAFLANTVVGNYIYFTGRNYATGELSVGVFNRQKLEVEWYYAAPEWQGSVPDDYEGNAVVLATPPQVTDDRLYVLENGTGTLYIFEKEQA